MKIMIICISTSSFLDFLLPNSIGGAPIRNYEEDKIASYITNRGWNSENVQNNETDFLLIKD